MGALLYAFDDDAHPMDADIAEVERLGGLDSWTKNERRLHNPADPSYHIRFIFYHTERDSLAT